MRIQWVLAAAIGVAVVGLGIFAVLIKGATDVASRNQIEAMARFAEVRATFEDPRPRVTQGPSGDWRVLQVAARPGRLEQLSILVYRASDQKLVSVEAPFWFVRMKGPALEFVFRDTGFNLRELGLTPRDLEAWGPGILLDEANPNGDHVLVWTQGTP